MRARGGPLVLLGVRITRLASRLLTGPLLRHAVHRCLMSVLASRLAAIPAVDSGVRLYSVVQLGGYPS